MKRAIITLLFLVCAGSVAVACEGDRITKLAGVAVSRCLHRTVTLSFDCPGERERLFVTVDDHDARELYETLKAVYEKTEVKP